jgi:hypothetical protein
LRSYHYIIETIVNEGRIKEEKNVGVDPIEKMNFISRKMQSVLVVYAESYSCLNDDSLVQDQYNPGLKNPSGSRQIRIEDDLREEKKRLLLSNAKENIRAEEDPIEKMKFISREKQSVIVVYAESYSCLQDDSLVQDQFNPGPKNPSGSQQIRIEDDSREGEKRLLLSNVEENSRVEERVIEER